MSICADFDWGMELVKDGSQDKDALTFYNLSIDNEIITGKVKDKMNNATDLKGTCSPFGSQETVGRLNFFFKAVGPNEPVEIFLSGLAILVPGKEKPVFRGGVVGLEPLAVGTSTVQVSFDVGDTGTGTGTQAMFRTTEP